MTARYKNRTGHLLYSVATGDYLTVRRKPISLEDHRQSADRGKKKQTANVPDPQFGRCNIAEFTLRPRIIRRNLYFYNPSDVQKGTRFQATPYWSCGPK